MKTIDDWAEDYFSNDEPDLRETLTDVRTEAFDASIEAIYNSERGENPISVLKKLKGKK